MQAFQSIDEFRAAYDVGMPGCLVLDVTSPLASGLELYEQVIREGKRLPVIFQVERTDSSPCAAGIKTGAIDFVEKNCEPLLLVERIDRALVLDRQWRQREQDDSAVSARIARLSDRDQDTLDLMLTGATDRAMASKLYVSRRAVEMRRKAIMRKLKVRSQTELLEMAITQRILTEISGTLSAAWRRG